MSQTVVLEENPLCPICGSKSSKSGFNNRGAEAVQIFKCKKCGKRFQENYVINVKASPNYVKGTKPRRRQTTRFRLKEIPDLSVLFKKPLSVESIGGIPCFCCEKNPCDPNTCEKLTEWLNENAN